MSEKEPEKAPSKLLVPTLVLSVFAASLSSPILTVLLTDITETFFGTANSATTGLSAQLSTAASIGEVIIGLLLGFLAVKFRYRSLLLLGLSFVVVSTAGSCLAPNFAIFQAFFILEGIGTVIVGIMAISLIGNTVTMGKKPRAVSYIIAVSFVTLLIGAPIVTVLTNITMSWRNSFLLYMLPISAVSLLLCYFVVPSSPIQTQKSLSEKQNYLQTFKQVLSNRSAVACLLGSLFFTGAIGFFVIAFFRNPMGFSVSRSDASLIVLGSTSLFILGSLAGGRAVNRLGAKTLTAVGALGDGVFIILLFFAPTVWIAVAFNFLHVWFAAMAMSGFGCLALDQIPSSRGSMMSIKSVFSNFGNALGSGIGGLMLITISYQALGLALGVMSLISALIVQSLTKDPYKANKTNCNCLQHQARSNTNQGKN